jgi:putative ABC transport system substrate-binding protein
MRRLPIILFVLALMGAGARAQEPGRMYRLGILFNSQTAFDGVRGYMLPELARLGFVEGQNLTVDMRAVPLAEMAEAARAMVAARPDVVVAGAIAAIRLLASAAPPTPVVMGYVGDDPVAAGLVESLRRPGGRITGQVILADELEPKRLTILLEALPRLRRIAVLAPDPPRNPLAEANVIEMATRVGVTVTVIRVSASDHYHEAFARMREAGAEALLISTSAELSSDASILADLALAAGLPTVCQWSAMARNGCLLGYGPSAPALRRRTADYVARIFRGADPGELPVERPTVFEFAVNLRTASRLGLVISPQVLVRADEVIE